MKVFPPAYRCPGEVSQLGKHAICGLQSFAKRDPCIIYSFAQPEDLHQLQSALNETVGHGKCDVFGYNLAQNGLMYVALPNNRAGPGQRMPFFYAPLDVDDTSGRLTVGEFDQDTEENYVEPWASVHYGEHAFLDVIRVSTMALI